MNRTSARFLSIFSGHTGARRGVPHCHGDFRWSARWRISEGGNRQRRLGHEKQLPSVSCRSRANENEEEYDAYSKESGVPGSEVAIGILATLGAGETGYLAFASLTHADVACPLQSGASSCATILSSSYAMLWDTVPLSLIGCVTYAGVAALAWSNVRTRATGERESEIVKQSLLGGGVLLVSASMYLLNVLLTEFPGETCPWCLTSIGLSVAIAAIIMAKSGKRDLENAAVRGAGLMTLTVLMLSLGLGNPEVSQAGSKINRLDYKDPEITTKSPPRALDLVTRLKNAQVKMYGAFWCSHCYGQKQAFGKDAMTDFPYVECFPEGWSRGVEMAPACKDAGLNGFPTWIIGNQRLEGEQSFDALEAALNALEAKS